MAPGLAILDVTGTAVDRYKRVNISPVNDDLLWVGDAQD